MLKQNIMNLLKKIYKPLIIIFSCGIIISLTLIIILKPHKEQVKFITVPYEYLLVGEDTSSFKCLVYSDEKDSIYLNKEMISKVYLTDSKNKESYLVGLKNIHQLDEALYNQETYYGYELEIILPFSESKLKIIPDCILKLAYPNDESICLNIGSIALSKGYDEHPVYYSSLNSIVQDYEELKMLKEVIVTLKADFPFLITNIEAISTIGKVNFNEVYQEGKDNLLIEGYGVLHIPITYENAQECAQMGFNLVYERDNEQFIKTIYPFKFFKTNRNLELKMVTYDIN